MRGGGASCRSATPAPLDVIARRLADEADLFRDPPPPMPVEVAEAWLSGIRSGENKMSSEDRRQMVARAAAEARAELMAQEAAAAPAAEEEALGWENYRLGRPRERSQSRGSRRRRPRTPGRGGGEAQPPAPIFSQTWGVSNPGTMPPGLLALRAEQEPEDSERRDSRPRSHSRRPRSQSRRRSQSRGGRWRGGGAWRDGGGWWQGGWGGGWDYWW